MKDRRPKKRKVIRDFHRRRYGNPLFAHTRSRRRGAGQASQGQWKKRFILGGSGIIGVVVLWFLFWSPTFRIDEIDIRGASPETAPAIRALLDEQVKSKKFFFLPQSNVFLFDTGRTERNISRYVFLESLEIRKKLPRTIIIEMVEKPIQAVLLEGNRFLALDKEAFVIRELSEDEIMALEDLPSDMVAVLAGELGAEVVELDDEEVDLGLTGKEDVSENRNPYPLILMDDRPAIDSGDMLTPGQEAIPPLSLSLISQAYERLPDITDESVRWFSIPDLSESIDVTMRSDWHIYFSEKIGFDLQGERLSLILKEKIGARRTQLEYIDLRYDERIFFRFQTSD